MAPEEDDRGGDERHQLPTRQEQQRIPRAEHKCQDEQESGGERRRRAACPVGRQVARCEKERGRANDAEDEEEEAARRIDAEARLERARKDAPARRRRRTRRARQLRRGLSRLPVQRGPRRTPERCTEGTSRSHHESPVARSVPDIGPQPYRGARRGLFPLGEAEIDARADGSVGWAVARGSIASPEVPARPGRSIDLATLVRSGYALPATRPPALEDFARGRSGAPVRRAPHEQALAAVSARVAASS